MQKRCRADDFIEDHQRSGHEGAGFELPGCGKGRIGLQVIHEEGTAGADSFGRNGALLRTQTQTNEMIREFAFGLFADKFVAGVAAPEINAADLEKLAGGTAEELDERRGVGALRGPGGDAEEELLKSIVRVRIGVG
jgi:hypothetical protein